MSDCRYILLTLCLLAAACGLSPRTVFAQAEAPAPDKAVQDGREALNGRTSFPFYDPQQDDVRRIDVQPQPEKKPNSPKKDWVQKPTTTAPGG